MSGRGGYFEIPVLGTSDFCWWRAPARWGEVEETEDRLETICLLRPEVFVEIEVNAIRSEGAQPRLDFWGCRVAVEVGAAFELWGSIDEIR